MRRSHQEQADALFIANLRQPKTTVKYRRAAIVRRADGGEPWNPRDGGGSGGGFVREYLAVEETKSPDEKLDGEIRLAVLIKVTAVEEPMP